MAHRRESHIRSALTSLIPPRRIRRLARELGALRRRRKVDVVALVYSLALGFASGSHRTIAGLRRAYERATSSYLAPSAFYDRLSTGLAHVLRELFNEALSKLTAERPRLHRVLGCFQQVLVADGSVIRLHEALAHAFPSVWTHHMPASAKLHVVINVVGRGPSRVQISRGSRQDVRLLQVGEWIYEKLLIFDQGYCSGRLFERIGEHGGFFLTPMRKHTNPLLLGAARTEHAHVVGRKLQDVLPNLGGAVLDLDGALRFRRRPKRGPYSTTPVRIVGLWNAAEARYHMYLTNIPRDRLAAEVLSAVYAARWEVELLFRELKTHYRIRDVRSRSRHVTECLLYASLLTLAASRRLHRLIAPDQGAGPQRYPLDRWAGLFALLASDLLDLLVGSPRRRSVLASRLRRLLLHEAPDPNLHRMLLPIRAQHGILARAA
jgi:DDE family transposase